MKEQLYLKFSSPSTTCSSLQAKLSVFKLISPPSPRILAMWLDERSRCLRCLSLSRFSITEILLQWRFKEIKPESRWTSNRLLICASIKQISRGNAWETTSKLFFPVAILHSLCVLQISTLSWRNSSFSDTHLRQRRFSPFSQIHCSRCVCFYNKQWMISSWFCLCLFIIWCSGCWLFSKWRQIAKYVIYEEI